MTMSISIEKASPVVGAEVLGVDTSVPASAETVERLGKALAEHGIHFFRDQHLTPEQHMACRRRCRIESPITIIYRLEGFLWTVSGTAAKWMCAPDPVREPASAK